MRLSRGVVLALVGLVVLSTTLAASAATAPSRNVSAATTATPTADATTARNGDADTVGSATADGTLTTGDDGGPRVLVGSQGGGTNWQKKGSVYLLNDQSVVWKLNDRDSYFDVTRLPNGHVVAGFMHNGYQTGCAPYDPPCSKTGFRVIDPSGDSPTVVSEFTFPIRGPTHSEVHDVEPLGDGRFVFADMEHERIAIVANGSVTWEWRAADSGVYDAPPDVTRRDWLHINDVDVIGEDRFLVSVRNANQLLIIERGAGVVEVINADTDDTDDGSCTKGGQLADFDNDGAVRCGDPSVMNHQHNPQWLGPGRVLVADSENDRIVELHRTDNGWTEAWTLTQAGGLRLQWPRDADRLPNGNTLVTDSLNRRIFEVTPDGEVTWSYATPLIPYEADPMPDGEVAGAYGPAGASSTGSTPARTTATTDPATGTAASGPTSPQTTTVGPSTPATSPTDAPDPDRDGLDASDIPGLSLLLVGIKAVFPRLPIWFGEFQLLVTVCSLGVVAVGLLDHRRR